MSGSTLSNEFKAVDCGGFTSRQVTSKSAAPAPSPDATAPDSLFTSSSTLVSVVPDSSSSSSLRKGFNSATSNDFLVSEHEDNNEDEAKPNNGKHLDLVTFDRSDVGHYTNGVLEKGKKCEGQPDEIPPEEPERVVDQDDGIGSNHKDEDDEDDEYEYEYEDDDGGNYDGFLVSDPPLLSSYSEGSSSTSTAAIVPPENEGLETAASNADEANSNSIRRSVSLQDESLISSNIANTAKSNAINKKSVWREPSRDAVSMSLRAEKEKTGGRRRLAQDLYKVMMADTSEAGFSIEQGNDEDRMDKWTIRLFGFDEESNLHKDLLILGLDHVELEMSFPDQYPFEPPFVRVVRPRFKRQTGFVMNGALCMELLTNQGWNPVNDIESVIVSVRSLLVVGEGRLQAALDIPEQERKTLLAAAIARRANKVTETDQQPDENDNNSSPAKKRKYKSSNSSNKVSKNLSVSKLQAGSYTTAEAKNAYQHLSDYHKRKGWDSTGWWAKKG
mmetsp:Transcript_1506/g.2159  ORF Transcript_1506/g.2159 Transcript_1506/m.2159 type:complete len:501 (+) Transcript_1506:226-1728(+)